VSPSRSRNRWKFLTAASARATDEARYRRPSTYSVADSEATNDPTAASSAAVASPTPAISKNAAYRLRSRRYASSVLGESPRSTDR